MYYVEKVINGVLCYKITPEGKWIPLNAEQLTRRLLEVKAKLTALKEETEINRRLRESSEAIGLY